jgi:hypothetical protein
MACSILKLGASRSRDRSAGFAMALGGTLKEFQLISRTVVQDIPHRVAHFMARNQQLSIEPLVPTSRDE